MTESVKSIHEFAADCDAGGVRSQLAKGASRREYRQCYFDSNATTPMFTDRGNWDESKQTLRWKSDLGDGL